MFGLLAIDLGRAVRGMFRLRYDLGVVRAGLYEIHTSRMAPTAEADARATGCLQTLGLVRSGSDMIHGSVVRVVPG